MPEGAEHLWLWFWRLHARRNVGFDLSPISLQEIETFGRLFGQSIRPWEASVLCDMDDAYLASIEKVSKEGQDEAKGVVKATPENVRARHAMMRAGKKKNGHRKSRPRG